MEKILIGILILTWISIALAEKYKMLPPVYLIEDYVTCLDKNNVYCKSGLRLHGLENSTAWKIINESKNDEYSLERSIAYRAICVPKSLAADSDSIQKFIENRTKEELSKYNLLGHIENVICTTGTVISSYDKLLLILIVAYVLLVLYATLYDRRQRKCTPELKNNVLENKVLISLSLISNWEKLSKTHGDEDFNRLKSVQGIRFFISVLIILAHTKLSYGMVYLANPEEIGKILSTFSIFVISAVLDSFLVQSFFLVSSWIATFQIYDIYRQHGKFTIKQIFILLINRYFRLSVCSTVMILVLQSSWYRLLDGPITFDSYEVTQKACQQNWWQTLFLMNNFLQYSQSCNPISWYLSADFHLYIGTLITIYLILKFKLNEWKVTSLLLFSSYILYGYFIYKNDMDIIPRLNTKLVRPFCFPLPDDFVILYGSTYACWSVGVVGVMFGFLYMKNKNRNIDNKKVASILCLLISLGLPSLAVMISKKQHRSISAVIFGPLVKPLFSAGIGVGILGMSHNIGGKVRRFLEKDIFVVLGNISFCTYIFQFLIIFSKGSGHYSMLEIGILPLIMSFLFIDLPFSIMAGIIGALLFEQPGINLQKMFLPQIRRGKQSKD